MKLEISYNGKVVGSLSAGETVIIPKEMEFKTDIVIRAVEDVKKLSAPTISISSETDDTLIISLVNNNDVSGRYWVYVNDKLVASPFTDIPIVEFSPKTSFFNVGINTIYATVSADGYEESEPSNVVEYVVKHNTGGA